MQHEKNTLCIDKLHSLDGSPQSLFWCIPYFGNHPALAAHSSGLKSLVKSSTEQLIQQEFFS